LTSTEKKNKNNKNTAFPTLNKKKKKPSVLDTKSIHSKISTNNRQKSTKKLTIKSKHYEHNRRQNYSKRRNQHLKNDKKVVNFSVAINDSYKTKQGERKEQTTITIALIG
jgi:glutamate synthase domain-containing protein 3